MLLLLLLVLEGTRRWLVGIGLGRLGRAAFERLPSATQQVSSRGSLVTWPEFCSTSQTTPAFPAESGGGCVVVEVVVVRLSWCKWCSAMPWLCEAVSLELRSKMDALSQKAAAAPNNDQPMARPGMTGADVSLSKKSAITSPSVLAGGGVRPRAAPPERTMRGRAAGRSAP